MDILTCHLKWWGKISLWKTICRIVNIFLCFNYVAGTSPNGGDKIKKVIVDKTQMTQIHLKLWQEKKEKKKKKKHGWLTMLPCCRTAQLDGTQLRLSMTNQSPSENEPDISTYLIFWELIACVSSSVSNYDSVTESNVFADLAHAHWRVYRRWQRSACFHDCRITRTYADVILRDTKTNQSEWARWCLVTLFLW